MNLKAQKTSRLLTPARSLIELEREKKMPPRNAGALADNVEAIGFGQS
jgi:hypothetical protein